MDNKTVRQACRDGEPLDGTDAKHLEHALQLTEDERGRLFSALKYINGLTSVTHLGRPRESDLKCVFCMSFFAMGDGYGTHFSKEDYDNLFKSGGKSRLPEPLTNKETK